MAKRAVREKETVITPAESEFEIGAVCSYYDNGAREGWRTGHIFEVEVDDDGDLLVTVQPVGSKYTTTKPRRVKHKSKDLRLA